MSDNFNPNNFFDDIKSFGDDNTESLPVQPDASVYSSGDDYTDTTAFDADSTDSINTSVQSEQNNFESIYNNTAYTSPYAQQNPYTDSNIGVQSSVQWGASQNQNYNTQPQYQNNYHTPYYVAPQQPKQKKEPKPVTKGFVAVILIVSIVLSATLGFAGGLVANKLPISKNDSSNGTLVVNKADIDEKTAEQLSDKPTSQIASEVADSVVEIVTEVMTTSSFYGQYISQGAGSGVIISQDGYIITNNHVIENASSITVTLKNGDSYKAELIGTDSIVDVALIKIEATGLNAATYGDSDKLKVGDKAVAIGNPLGQLGGTVTDGIISALNRDVVIDGTTMNLLQTDTAINPGNSGGGLFDGQGVLVGMVVAKSSGEEIEGLGFAIPINNVIDIIDDLKTYGYVKGRVTLGMELMDLTNNLYAMYYYRNTTPGCYVYSVNRNSNAEQAGIRTGDRIVSVNGTSVSSKDDVESALSTAKVGDKVIYEIDRQGNKTKITVELEEYVPVMNNNQNDNPFSNYYNPFG